MTTRTVEEIKAELAEAEFRDRQIADSKSADRSRTFVGRCFVGRNDAIRIKSVDVKGHLDLEVGYSRVIWDSDYVELETEASFWTGLMSDFLMGKREISVEQYKAIVSAAQEAVENFNGKLKELL